MCGSGEGVLYVGKAKNLKKRLGSYRVANPEKFSRRILRLLHCVTRIEWDECADDSAAGYREELLIAVLQPRFNRAGKVWPLNPGDIQHFNIQRSTPRLNLARYCLGDMPVAFLYADHKLFALR